MIRDSQEGSKATAVKVLKVTWQRCRVHFMRNALAQAGKTQRRMVSAAIGAVFVQESAESARTAATRRRSTARQVPQARRADGRGRVRRTGFHVLPRAHWTPIYSTNPLERLNAAIKRRTHVVDIFHNDASIVRLVGATMLEQDDEWSLNRRCMQFEGLQTPSDTVPTRLAAVAR